jgi:hypothetical protein
MSIEVSIKVLNTRLLQLADHRDLGGSSPPEGVYTLLHLFVPFGEERSPPLVFLVSASEEPIKCIPNLVTFCEVLVLSIHSVSDEMRN